jgi:hypothetical protein
MSKDTPRDVAEPRFRLIGEVVAAEMGVPLRALMGAAPGGRPPSQVAHARQTAQRIARRLTRRSLADIAYYLGQCSHSTVLQGIREAEKRLAADAVLAEKLARMLAVIGERHKAELEAMAAARAAVQEPRAAPAPVPPRVPVQRVSPIGRRGPRKRVLTPRVAESDERGEAA